LIKNGGSYLIKPTFAAKEDLSNMTSSILKYFHSCYMADLRAVQVIDFLAKKVSFPHFEADPAWASQTWHKHPVPDAWGQEVYKHLIVNGKEEQLYACAFMLAGKAKVLGKTREICTPLYLIPSDLNIEGGVYMVTLNYSGMVLNPAFTEILSQDEATAEGLFQHLQQLLPMQSLGFEEQHAIEKAFKSLHLPVDTEGLFDFPIDLDKKGLESVIQAQQSNFKLIPILGLGVIEKSVGSLGILNELNEMANSKDFSPVIQYFFENKINKNTAQTTNDVLLPVSLSESQSAILKSCMRETLTVVNGPPGTGKSFTIAAIAAHQFSIGGSILIAAKNTQAVEVIADKLERTFRLQGLPVRASQTDYRSHLRKRLRAWLHGLGLKKINTRHHTRSKAEMVLLERRIRQQWKKIEQLFNNEIRITQMMRREDLSWMEKIQKWSIELSIKRNPPLWRMMEDMEKSLQQSHSLGAQLMTETFHVRLARVLKNHRPYLQKLWEALKTNSGNEKEQYFKGVRFSKILQAMPIWLVNSAHVHQVLPLEKELFDLVIIDEASQSDIASTLPLLQRAKRAVIVGDPNQLRHLSFLSIEQQNKFLQNFDLQSLILKKQFSFRDTSILDLAFDSVQSQQQVHFLDEHFRSLPGIIAFSNQRFYNTQLKIMTATPQNLTEETVLVINTKGRRTASGYNTLEAEEITNQILKIIQSEADLEEHLCQSIGVLSPFRAQVDVLKKQLSNQCSSESWLRHRILIGSPFDFQGEERDIMFISWVLDAQSPPGAFAFLNREDVFNVSITRARSRQYLYTSSDVSGMPVGNLLREYIESLSKQTSKNDLIGVETDHFMDEVIRFLKHKGVTHLIPHYHIAGMDIDLVVVYDGKTYCIDLVGYPGTSQNAVSIARWNMLSRVGMHGFVLPYRLWHTNRGESQTALWDFISAT
jgi:AAA domain